MSQIGDRRGFSNFETDLLCGNMRAVDSICTSDEDLVQPLMMGGLEQRPQRGSGNLS